MSDRPVLDQRPSPDDDARPGFGIRPVRPDDHDALADLTVTAYLTTPEGVGDGPYRDELRDVAGRAAAAEVLVAVDADDTVLGGIAYIPDATSALAEFDDPEAAGIRMLAVAPAAGRRGIGRALTTACIDRARAAGRRRIVLHTTAGNAVAQRMYEGMGFRRDPAADWLPEPEVQLLGYELLLD
jgi:ribosomal protein S18 acetylase RimI-like enzyme